MGSLSNEQQEIIELLQQEVAEFSLVDTTVFTDGGLEQQQALLTQWCENLEPIVGALDIAGLPGLMCSCEFLRQQFNHLLESNARCPQTLLEPLQSWTLFVLAYLHNIGTESEDNVAGELISFLCLPHWPIELTEKKHRDIVEAFTQPYMQLESDENERPVIATQAMASLALGPDVDQELIEGLQIELPEQAKQFEESVDSYLQTNLLADLSTAQRMAHTLKGTGHIVEVMGIANMMHHTEDLLEAAAKGRIALPKNFNEILISVADCLAAITDHLCDNGEPPDNVQAVLQSLLDAGNALHGGADQQISTPSVNTSPQSDNHEVEISQTEIPATQTPPATADNSGDDNSHQEKQHLSISENTAQELLRLAGEIQITNGRAATQIGGLQVVLNQTADYQRRIKAMAAELELIVEAQSTTRAAAGDRNGNLDPLEMERFSELHSFANRLAELTTDSYESIQQMTTQLRNLNDTVYTQTQLNQDNQHQLLELRMVAVDSFAARFTRCVRQACRLTGKQVEFSIDGTDLRIDSRILARISSPILHLLRNAVDHGIEAVDTRINQGKPENGKIHLSFAQRGETITIQCQDDGAGLDHEKIRQTAIERGLLQTTTEGNTNVLNQIILMPGFSTRQQVTQTSGRGIGLDAVAADVKALKGHISVTSIPGHSCCFTLTVPSSILTRHALVVRTTPDPHSQHLSIVSRHIKQIIYLAPDERLDLDCDDHWVYENKRIPLYDINTLINSRTERNQQVSTLLIINKTDGAHVAVAVGAALTSQNLVVKQFNQYTFHPEGVIGATILGDGSVSPMINLPDLPGMNLSVSEMKLLHRGRQALAIQQEEKANPVCALIVDDSLSARRSLAQFIGDLGMDVLTAKDGFEAIHIIQEKKPNLLLVDMEMPRMNGLELTTHLRSQPETREIPVIMISSRSTQKHQTLARSAGVNAYLNKPWSDDELLQSMNQLLAG